MQGAFQESRCPTNGLVQLDQRHCKGGAWFAVFTNAEETCVTSNQRGGWPYTLVHGHTHVKHWSKYHHMFHTLGAIPRLLHFYKPFSRAMKRRRYSKELQGKFSRVSVSVSCYFVRLRLYLFFAPGRLRRYRGKGKTQKTLTTLAFPSLAHGNHLASQSHEWHEKYLAAKTCIGALGSSCMNMSHK